ncbi:hypothetical protein PG991_012271 [Apiospora marii]|uniref:Heterokaryon incompatibility domain-containing protein n=1 Tax=Apiospora marii TaxID=335849 RepID=A0ABR1R999_9PEZI
MWERDYYGIQQTLKDAEALWQVMKCKLGNEQRKSVLQSLCQSRWFKRVWIIQEVASARSAVVLCGSRCVSSGVFSVMPHLMKLETDSHSTAVLEVMPGPLRKQSWWTQDHSLLRLLAKFHHSEATLEHDRIYALLGIASDAPDLPIDYACPLQHVVDQTVSVLMLGDASPSRFLKKQNMFDFSQVFSGIADTASFATRVYKLALRHSEEIFLKCLIDTPVLRLLAQVERYSNKYDCLPYEWAVFFLYDDFSTAHVTDMRHGIFKRALQGHHYFICNKVCETDGFIPKPWDLKGFLPSITDSAFETIVKRIRADKHGQLDWILEHAVRSGHRRQLHVLLDHGFDQDKILDDNLINLAIDGAPDDKGLRAVLERRKIAGLEGPPATGLLWRALFSHRKHIDEHTSKGIVSGRMSILNFLIDNGADIEARQHGVTPVFAAVVLGLPGVVRLLAERGADLNSRQEAPPISLGPVTPLHYAESRNFQNCIATLILGGADEFSEDCEGRTPWQHNEGKISTHKRRDKGEFSYLISLTEYRRHIHMCGEFLEGREDWAPENVMCPSWRECDIYNILIKFNLIERSHAFEYSMRYGDSLQLRR